MHHSVLAIMIVSVIPLVGCDSRDSETMLALGGIAEPDDEPAVFSTDGLGIYRPGVYSAVWTSKEQTGSTKEVRGKAMLRHILCGQFVEIDVEVSGSTSSMAKSVIRYDPESGTYHAWHFRDNGVAVESESRPSDQEPRKTVSEGYMDGLKYRGSTVWSEDYREIVETYQWYDAGDRLLRTDVGRFSLPKAQPDAAPEPPPAAAVLESSEPMNPKPQSEVPAADGGR